MQEPQAAADTSSTPPTRIHRAATTSTADAASRKTIKCPELVLSAAELAQHVSLQQLYKKGKRFESGWDAFFVGVYAHVLLYYESEQDAVPRGVVPLAGSRVKAVDRIFKTSSSGSDAAAEDCGPCWQLTSRAGRVLLFRSPSLANRQLWLERMLGSIAATEPHAASASSLRRYPHHHTAPLSSSVALVRGRSHSSHHRSSFESASAHNYPAATTSRRRRSTSRLSLDETQLVTTTTTTTTHGGRRASASDISSSTIVHRRRRASREAAAVAAAAVAVDVGHEVSEMLRDAMQLVKQQKLEIEELKRQLQCAITQPWSMVDAFDDTAFVAAVVDSAHDSPLLKQDAEKEKRQVIVPDQSRDIDIDEGEEDDVKQEAAAPKEPNEESAPLSPPVASAEEEKKGEEKKEEEKEDLHVVIPAAPLSAPAALAGSSQDTDATLPSTSATKPEVATTPYSTVSMHPLPKRSGSFGGGGTAGITGGNEYLQQQAMELAEIARNLQSSFRTDFRQQLPAKPPVESAPSSASTYVDSFGQLNTSTSELLNEDMFSFDQSHLFDDDDDDDDDGEYERLSEFDESDEHFLEANGILDSIHQVMKDFIVTAQPETKQPTDQIIISDDVIAEIRQGIERKDAEEARRLRNLRSLSEHGSEMSDFVNGPDPSLQRAKSARDFMSDYGVASGAKMSRPRRDLGTLVVEDTMAVVSSVLQTAAREEKMILLYPLLRLFGCHDRLSRLIRWAIEMEVASVFNVATLFRSDDYASRLVSSYSKSIGSDFLQVVLTDPIREIFALKIADLELNPDKLEGLREEGSVKKNADNLMRACQHILDAILRNTHLIPASYYHICSHLNAKVIRRFDGSIEGIAHEDPATLTRSVIGGFLFLRFVCPAMTTPHLYNLVDKEPPPETRRVLVLITKLLFKTATCVMFGEREPQFKILNPFIERNSPAIQQLFIELSSPPDKDIDECFAADSRGIFSDVTPLQLESDMAVIRTIAEKNLTSIATKLTTSGCSKQITSEFQVAVLAPPEPRDVAVDPFLIQKHMPKVTRKLSNMKFLSFGKRTRKPQTEV